MHWSHPDFVNLTCHEYYLIVDAHVEIIKLQWTLDNIENQFYQSIHDACIVNKTIT